MKTYENGTHYDFTEPANNAGDVIKQAVKGGKNEMAIVHLANVIKYSIRLFKKHDDPVKDAQKIVNYAQELLAELQKDVKPEDCLYLQFRPEKQPSTTRKLNDGMGTFSYGHMLTWADDIRHVYRGSEETFDNPDATIGDLEYLGLGIGKELV